MAATVSSHYNTNQASTDFDPTVAEKNLNSMLHATHLTAQPVNGVSFGGNSNHAAAAPQAHTASVPAEEKVLCQAHVHILPRSVATDAKTGVENLLAGWATPIPWDGKVPAGGPQIGHFYYYATNEVFTGPELEALDAVTSLIPVVAIVACADNEVPMTKPGQRRHFYNLFGSRPPSAQFPLLAATVQHIEQLRAVTELRDALREARAVANANQMRTEQVLQALVPDAVTVQSHDAAWLPETPRVTPVEHGLGPHGVVEKVAQRLRALQGGSGARLVFATKDDEEKAAAAAAAAAAVPDWGGY